MSEFKNPNFNYGNQKYQLIIRQNTVVTLLRKQRIVTRHCPEETKLISFDSLQNEDGRVSKLSYNYIYTIFDNYYLIN